MNAMTTTLTGAQCLGTSAAPARRPHPPRAQRGVTLIELMVGISILVILSTIGIPGMQHMITTHRASTLANELTLALTLARSEAVRRGALVEVCPSSDGATCGGRWRDGWLIVPEDATLPRDADLVVGVWTDHPGDLGPYPTGAALADDEAGSEPSVVFNGLGGADQARTFTVGTDDTGRAAGTRLIDLSGAGRLALKVRSSDG